MSQLTVERFLREVRDHKLTILRDEGLYRHLRFKAPGTMMEHFDMVTWPGYLCFTGDMGTFVFTRLADMLVYFRCDDDLFKWISYRKWAEKLESVDKPDGYQEFDEAAFKREITVQRRRLLVSHGRDFGPGQRQELWESLQWVIDAANEGEHQAISAMQDWVFGFTNKLGRSDRLCIDTDEFPSCKRYTDRFLFCCYALRWGIHQYDAQRIAQELAEVTAVNGERST